MKFKVLTVVFLCSVVFAGVVSASSLNVLGVPILERWSSAQVHDHLRDVYGLGNKKNRQGLRKSLSRRFVGLPKSSKVLRSVKSVKLKESGIWLRRKKYIASPFPKVDIGLKYTKRAAWMFYKDQLASMEIVFIPVFYSHDHGLRESEKQTEAYITKQVELYNSQYGVPTVVVDDTGAVPEYKRLMRLQERRRADMADMNGSDGIDDIVKWRRLRKEYRETNDLLLYIVGREAIAVTTKTWVTDGGSGKIDLIKTITHPTVTDHVEYRLRYSNVQLANQAYVEIARETE